MLAEPDKGYRLRKLVIVDGPAFLTWQVVSVRKTEQHGNELRLREWVNFGHPSDLSPATFAKRSGMIDILWPGIRASSGRDGLARRHYLSTCTGGDGIETGLCLLLSVLQQQPDKLGFCPH